MQARMTNPAMVVPGAMKALIAFGDSAQQTDVPLETLELVKLRAGDRVGWRGGRPVRP